MDPRKIDVKTAMLALQEEIRVMQAAFRERGTHRFVRAVLVAVVMVLGAHILVYRPPKRAAADLQRQIEQRRATAAYADQFKTLRDRMREVHALLPGPHQKDDWITNAVVEAMKAENIFSNINPPDKNERDGIVTVGLQVSMNVSFAELVNLLNRLEQTKPLLHVSEVSIGKSRDQIGVNAIRLEVQTLVPLEGPP